MSGGDKLRAKARLASRAKPEPSLILREAGPKDARAIAGLIASLGYDVEPGEVRRRLSAVATLVAARGEIVGALTLGMTAVLHRPRPVGRITMLVIAEQARGGGIGRALVAEAERRLAAAGCGLVEVTSNRKRLRAHGFYERLGYERTSHRFAKSL